MRHTFAIIRSYKLLTTRYLYVNREKIESKKKTLLPFGQSITFLVFRNNNESIEKLVIIH